MAEIGEERFGARDGEKGECKRDKADMAMQWHERDRIKRVDRRHEAALTGSRRTRWQEWVRKMPHQWQWRAVARQRLLLFFQAEDGIRYARKPVPRASNPQPRRERKLPA